MTKGKIVKGIAGFYYVNVVGSGIYECKAKGAFRNKNLKPSVGDDVAIDIISNEKMTGNITDILPRKNALIRPAVANVDQALVVFAAKDPEPNLNLLDRFLVMMEMQDVPTYIVFNKTDLADEELINGYKAAYANSGYEVITISAGNDHGIDSVREILKGKTSTVAGPSGVGKSTLINLLAPDQEMETGSISDKVKRGKHTTRHSELICIDEDTYIFDTPGFSSLSVDFTNPADKKKKSDIPVVTAKNLGEFFPEIAKHSCECRFIGCVHVNEPDCAVKDALANGEISQSRYDNYVQIYNELKNKKEW